MFVCVYVCIYIHTHVYIYIFCPSRKPGNNNTQVVMNTLTYQFLNVILILY